jgi:hypothetical protein
LKPNAWTGRLLAGLALYALSVTPGAARDYVNPDRLAIRDIRSALQLGDCKGAVANLKPGLKAKQPDVLLIAGLMYEEGYCVAADWNKAAGLYMLADDAGNRSAIPRLTAGYARPGRDNGSALAWAAKAPPGMYPKPCVPNGNPDTDPNGFNDELERMPPRLFQGCVYLVGVVGEMYAQGQFPPLALLNNVTGKFTMEFNPSKGTIGWRVEELEQGQAFGIRDMAKADLDNPRTIRNSLLKYLKEKGEYALSRYPKPETDFPADWTVTTTFIFVIN